ncbi:MAG: tetratricopeptide repeat protein [Bacteroidota bacterium]|nr:tetratricopeptide repeat protein [Bacteroidota bacterium]
MKRCGTIVGCLLTVAAFAQKGNNEILKGNEAYQKGDYNAALAFYRKALQQNEKNYIAQFNTGNALQKQQQYAEAAKQYQSVAEHATDTSLQSKALYNKGVAEIKQQQIDQAIQSFKQALRINPKDEETRENLQKALNEKNKKNNSSKKNQQNKQEQQKEKKSQSNLSQQQAEKLLNQLRNEEKKLMDYQKQKVKQNRPDKDW